MQRINFIRSIIGVLNQYDPKHISLTLYELCGMNGQELRDTYHKVNMILSLTDRAQRLRTSSQFQRMHSDQLIQQIYELRGDTSNGK